VREIVGNSTGNFIWINKFGIHKPYRDSYPPEAAKWHPTVLNDDRSMTYRGEQNREKIVNDYDNSLLYNSQSFFSTLFETGAAQKTFYFYTADHGQSLLENGNLASHGSDAKPEANVPLFIISAPEILPAADTGFRAAHFNIFPTLLDLMNIPEQNRREKYALSLFKAKTTESAPRRYAGCSLHQPSIAKTYLFDEY
jgi:glucan phosphoethanolaminetransferase (alkaline phosphatase superfamily)